MDDVTREDPNNDIRLEREVFLKISATYGPFDTDLMASPANVQKDLQGRRLPFYSQYFTDEAMAADVFSVDIAALGRPGLPRSVGRA